MKRFNVTGLCVPHKHYMVDISDKLAKIEDLIDKECYFTINRARQFGKTTTLAALERILNDQYVVASISFEGLGNESFSSAAVFINEFLELMREALQFSSAEDGYGEEWVNKNVITFSQLSRHIALMCKDKKVVLMIDEVDKASNNQVFLDFLSVLRKKFLARENGKDYTFHSVVLAGVYDIKNIKLKMMLDGKHIPANVENKVYNSPWNIAVNFRVDMSFNPNEIASMLAAYEDDHHTGMCTESISEEIYTFTSGYPFLVSRICQCIDEELNRNWTIAGVQSAVKTLINEKNTLFDDLSKNLENNEKLYRLIYDVLIVGEQRLYSAGNPTVDLASMYGIIKESNRNVIISNKVYEIIICDYFISKDEETNRQITGVLQHDVVRDGIFDMELCLSKFAEYYAEIFNEHDVKFLERHGRLLFLSYLKPLINGQGFYHIESEFTDLRRMDLVVDFGRQQFIIELKVWRGKQYLAEAYEQLCAYLDSKNIDKGYLITFDIRKKSNRTRKSEWVEVSGKSIFDVMV